MATRVTPARSPIARFRYLGVRLAHIDVRTRLEQYKSEHDGAAPRNPGTEYFLSPQDDAFETIVQWLYERIPYVRGGAKQ